MDMMVVQLSVVDLRNIIAEAVSLAIEKTDTVKEAEQENNNDTDVLGAKEVCAMLHIKPITLYTKTANNLIPHYKQGNRLYFSKTELQKWILNGRKLTQEEREELASQILFEKNRRKLKKHFNNQM